MKIAHFILPCCHYVFIFVRYAGPLLKMLGFWLRES